MKYAIPHWLFCLLATFSLCVNDTLRAEEKNIPATAPETEPGKPPMPPPPPGEHKLPFGQQFNVRGRIHALLENLQQNDPEEYQRLMKLRNENREKYLKELWGKLPERERENDNRKKIAEIDRKCWELGVKHQKAATEQEKNDIKAELSVLLDQSMDLVMQDTRERLERIQKILDNLNNNRGKIIQERLEQFLSGKPAAQRPERPNNNP